MWREYDMARQVTADRERELRAAVLSALASGRMDTPRHSRVRETTAGAVRRLGQAVIALSNRIDDCAAHAERLVDREIAFR